MLLEDIRLLRSRFDLQYQYLEEDVEDIEISLKLGHTYEEDLEELTVVLTVISEQRESPFHFEIEYGGKFKIEAAEVGEIDRLSQINCPAIIFPYIREHIADLTRRAGLKPFHIGPVNFVNLRDSNEQE